MNLHTIHEFSEQTSDRTDAAVGEPSQVNALLHVIETLQAQSEGLSTEQQKTITELKGRVEELTDKQTFLESELLAERENSAELKKQHEAQERARVQKERARLEAVRKANEVKRKQLEAKKAMKRDQLKLEIWKANQNIEKLKWLLNYDHVPIQAKNEEKFSWLESFPLVPGWSAWHCVTLNDPSTRVYLSQELNRWESLAESLNSQLRAII